MAFADLRSADRSKRETASRQDVHTNHHTIIHIPFLASSTSQRPHNIRAENRLFPYQRHSPNAICRYLQQRD
jgi:hypothetical protein